MMDFDLVLQVSSVQYCIRNYNSGEEFFSGDELVLCIRVIMF